MTTEDRKQHLAALAEQCRPHIDALTPDMKPIVDKIENGMMSGTTQHNYAGYMSTLAELCPDNDARMLYIVCRAMIAAGGNEAGIKAAAAINTGRDPLGMT